MNLLSGFPFVDDRLVFEETVANFGGQQTGLGVDLLMPKLGLEADQDDVHQQNGVQKDGLVQ